MGEPAGPKGFDTIVFAAKLRGARAVLGWTQTQLGKKAGLTQRAIYRIEIAASEARQDTRSRIENVLKDAGIDFEDVPNGGFRMFVSQRVLTKRRR